MPALAERPHVPDLASRFAQRQEAITARMAAAREITNQLASDGIAVINLHSPQIPNILRKVGQAWQDVIDRSKQTITEARDLLRPVMVPATPLVGALLVACFPQAVAQEASPGQKGPDAPVAAAKPAELTTPVPVGGDVDKIPDLEIRAIGLRLLNPETAGQVSNADRERFNQYYLTNLAESQKQAPAEAGQKSVPAESAARPGPQPDLPKLSPEKIAEIKNGGVRNIAEMVARGEAISEQQQRVYLLYLKDIGLAPVSPPESQKPPMPELIPAGQIRGEIASLVATIKSIEKPYSPRATQLSHEGAKATFENMMNRAQAAITRGNMEAAQKELLDAKNMLREFGDPLQEKDIPEEERKKHDPLGKYLRDPQQGKGRDSIDPRLLPQFLRLSRIAVSVHPDYQAEAAKSHSLAIPSERTFQEFLVSHGLSLDA